MNGGVYRLRTDGGAQQPRPSPEPSTAHQQGAPTSASASATAPDSASAHATSGQASGLPSYSSEFWHPSAEHAGQAPGSHHYSPPGSTHFREEDYRTGEQRPLFKPERHTFDATPKTEQWTTFRASFDAAVGSRRMPDAQKLLMLIDLASGEPKKIARRIAGDVYDTRSYIQVWHTLEEHYDGLNRAKKDVLHKLETFPKIAKFNKDNALEFSSLLLNILNKYANQGPGLTDEGWVLSSLAKKIIPEFEVVIYFQKLAEYDRPDNLTEFYKFIEQKRIALNLASAHFAPAPKQGLGLAALTQQDAKPEEDEGERGVQQSWGQDYGLESRELSKRGDPPQRGESKGEPKSDPKSTELPPCPVCKAKHKLFHCDDFKAMTTNKRYYATRDARYCYHCLGPNHSAKNCTWHKDVKCGLENCTRYHHPLLHNFKAQMLITFEEFVGAQTSLPDISQHSASQFTGEDDYVSIRTATILITGPTGKPYRCIAALDSCSNSTNIDADLAKELGLRVNQTGFQREINTMERVVQVASDHVSFMISPVNGRTSYPVDAFTVKDLVRGSPVVNWQDAAKQFAHLQEADIPNTKTTDKVQVLLGADYMHLMAASRSLIGKENEPTAELCRLGWAFAG